MQRERFKTPSEILFDFPIMERIWDARKIGYLFYCQLIKGRKMPRGCLVSEADVVKLYEDHFGKIDNS